MILYVARIFVCRKAGSISLLVWFIRSELLRQLSLQIWVIFRNHIKNCRVYCFNKLGLLRTDYGEFGILCVLFHCMRWFRCIRYTDCFLSLDYGWNWMGYYETRGFFEFFHWSYGPCWIPFRQVINKCCDCLCCHLWYCYAVVDENSLGFSTRLTWSNFDLHCQMWEMDGPCVVSMTTLLCLMKCNPIIVPVKFFITTNCSA